MPVPLPLPPASGVHSERAAFRRALGLALGLAMAIAATYAVPALRVLRPWVPGGTYVPFWNLVGREFLGEGKKLRAEQRALEELQRSTALALPSAPEPKPAAPAAPAPLQEAVFPPYAQVRVAPPDHLLEPPEAVERFLRKLTLVDLGVEGTVARAGHWGDSVLGVDGITSGIRRRLQTRFGDAGHGFHLMDRYNPSYRQQGIEFVPGGGWNRCLVVFECSREDRRYGYGGLIARSNGGAAAMWSTTSTGFGKTASLFELWFAYQEQGGRLEVSIDGQDKYVVDTRGPHLEDGFYLVSVQPGAHSFTVRALGGGPVRTYGVVLENDGPGVVWDGISLIGGSTRGLRTQLPEHIAGQVRRRGLDLVVFMFGGNDLARVHVDLKGSMEPYYAEYSEVLKNFRAGRPEADCLIMSVTDHGERLPDGRIQSRQFAKRLARAQREVARRNGCAFFDTYEATGGEGTAGRWYSATPRLISPDLGHPNGLGHEVIAGLLAKALLHAYDEYRVRMAGKPLPELGAALATLAAQRQALVSQDALGSERDGNGEPAPPKPAVAEE